MEDDASGVLKAWVNLDQIGHQGACHLLLAATLLPLVVPVADSGGQLDALTGWPPASRPAQAVAVDTRRGVVHRPQPVAAVATRIVR